MTSFDPLTSSHTPLTSVPLPLTTESSNMVWFTKGVEYIPFLSAIQNAALLILAKPVLSYCDNNSLSPFFHFVKNERTCGKLALYALPLGKPLTDAFIWVSGNGCMNTQPLVSLKEASKDEDDEKGTIPDGQGPEKNEMFDVQTMLADVGESIHQMEQKNAEKEQKKAERIKHREEYKAATQLETERVAQAEEESKLEAERVEAAFIQSAEKLLLSGKESERVANTTNSDVMLRGTLREALDFYQQALESFENLKQVPLQLKESKDGIVRISKKINDLMRTDYLKGKDFEKEEDDASALQSYTRAAEMGKRLDCADSYVMEAVCIKIVELEAKLNPSKISIVATSFFKSIAGFSLRKKSDATD